MDYLPLFFDVKGKPCLIVGGGAIALRKARLLVKAQADIKVIALKVCTELRELVTEAGGEVIEREYQSEDIGRLSLVIAATDNHPLNAQISSDAQAANVPVNVVDSPELCTVITPAIIDRSPLIIGVSSGGRAPVLARMARAKIEALLPSSYGQLAELASRLREKDSNDASNN